MLFSTLLSTVLSMMTLPIVQDGPLSPDEVATRMSRLTDTADLGRAAGGSFPDNANSVCVYEISLY
jgi:hypothetical protein